MNHLLDYIYPSSTLTKSMSSSNLYGHTEWDDKAKRTNQQAFKKPISPVRSKDNFLVFGAPAIEESEIEEVVATLRSGWLCTGPKVELFERNFKRYKCANYAIAVNSCTAALHLSLLVAGVKPGDEVITTPLTFCATVNAIIHAGAIPVLADINPSTMNIDPEQIERRITPRTRAILPVHFAGRPCDMESIMEIAQKYNLKVIEDCAHAIETEYKGKKAGTFGDFGCFSFYVTKNVVTGEGGMVLTKTKEAADRIKTLALHGISKDAWKRFSEEGYKHYYVVEPGYKYNMMDIQAAMGIHQLKRLDENWLRRQQIWDMYNSLLTDLPITLPSPPDANTRHAYHLYTILIDKREAGISRDEFLKAMTEHNIGVGVHYMSIPEHPYYRKLFGWDPKDFPIARRIGRQTVSLPLSPKLTVDDVRDVVEAVKRILR
jgi:dTDP-4-amino-4,6-dideoxygalactose transaminase